MVWSFDHIILLLFCFSYLFSILFQSQLVKKRKLTFYNFTMRLTQCLRMSAFRALVTKVARYFNPGYFNLKLQPGLFNYIWILTIIMDVSTGATGVTAVAPKCSNTLSNPIPTRGQILPTIAEVATKFFPWLCPW